MADIDEEPPCKKPKGKAKGKAKAKAKAKAGKAAAAETAKELRATDQEGSTTGMGNRNAQSLAVRTLRTQQGLAVPTRIRRRLGMGTRRQLGMGARKAQRSQWHRGQASPIRKAQRSSRGSGTWRSSFCNWLFLSDFFAARYMRDSSIIISRKLILEREREI